jgi:Flp pilus assembly protein TadG
MSDASRLVRRLVADKSGVSAIVIALSLTAILGFAGLAVDASLWYGDKRLAQGAADSAAVSGAATYGHEAATLGTTSAVTNAKAIAKAVAATYGFTNGSGGVTVTVNNPPLSGSHTSSAGAFEVIITKRENLFFSNQYLSSVSVSSRGVGLWGTVTTGSGAGGCFQSLNPNAYASINMSNGVTVIGNNCGVYDNSTGSGALSVIGGANLTAASLSVVGAITQNNGGSVNISGSKVTGASSMPDPYASYSVASAESAFTGCPNSTPTSYSAGGAKYTLSPGYYCGGLSVSNGVSVTFSPGIYIIDGGSFSLESGNNIATGGVTIVLTGSGSNYASFSIGNGATLAINAPATGPTAGIAFYGDPANTASVTMNGGASVVTNGAYYFPGQTVNFSNGTSNSASCTQLIAYNIVFTGGSTFSINCAGYGTKQIGGSSTTTSLSLVE